MTRHRTILGLCLAACALAAPAAAQQQQQRTDTPDIVVTGQAEAPPTSSEVTRQARQITQGGDFRHSPLARFEDRLCPGVMGLQLDAAELMVDRIRWNAENLGLDMASEDGCAPNLIVAFVPDAKGQLAALHREHQYLFASLDSRERRALLDESGPVRVWTTTVMRTRDGMAVASQGAPRPGDAMSNVPVVSMWMAHSKIYLPIRQDIAQVIVVFDQNQVKGKTVIQLADYATMRGLAKTKPSGDAAMDTILALFSGDSPPTGLTQFDRAYLASLYDGIPNLPATARIGGVNRQLRRQAAAAGQPEAE